MNTADDKGWAFGFSMKMRPPDSLEWLEPFGELRRGQPRPITGAIQWHVPLAPTDDPAKRAAYLDALMEHTDERHRQRWCTAKGGCACMGCANLAGHLLDAGFTREEWQAWWDARGGLPPRPEHPVNIGMRSERRYPLPPDLPRDD